MADIKPEIVSPHPEQPIITRPKAAKYPRKAPPKISNDETYNQLCHVWRIIQLPHLLKKIPQLHFYTATFLKESSPIEDKPHCTSEEVQKILNALKQCNSQIAEKVTISYTLPLSDLNKYNSVNNEKHHQTPTEEAIHFYLSSGRFDLASYLLGF